MQNCSLQMFVFKIYVLWIEFVLNQKLNMHFLRKYTNKILINKINIQNIQIIFC